MKQSFDGFRGLRFQLHALLREELQSLAPLGELYSG
jgi:hypothetical protein